MIAVQADEMAKTFRQRVAQAEAAARAEELRLQQEVWDYLSLFSEQKGLPCNSELNLPMYSVEWTSILCYLWSSYSSGCGCLWEWIRIRLEHSCISLSIWPLIVTFYFSCASGWVWSEERLLHSRWLLGFRRAELGRHPSCHGVECNIECLIRSVVLTSTPEPLSCRMFELDSVYSFFYKSSKNQISSGSFEVRLLSGTPQASFVFHCDGWQCVSMLWLNVTWLKGKREHVWCRLPNKLTTPGCVALTWTLKFRVQNVLVIILKISYIVENFISLVF